MKMIYSSIILSFALLIHSPVVSAQLNCAGVHYQKSHREIVVDNVLVTKTPAMMSREGVPVLLMSKDTVQALKPLVSNSMGVLVALQPHWKNDHGLARVGNYIIDVDTPGARNFGEIHQTGLAWKSVEDYVPRMNAQSNRIVEVLFMLSPAEMETAITYQKVRRAAIYRVPFTFGGAKNDMTQLNTLKAGGEHCFIFCRGGSVPEHVREMEAEIKNKTGKTFAEWKQIKEVNDFLDGALKMIYETKDVGEGALNPRISLKAPHAAPVSYMIAPKKADAQADKGFFARIVDQVKDRLKVETPNAEALEVMNWMIGLESSMRYKKLLSNLGMDSYGSGWAEIRSPRASAILIYDNTATAEAFQKQDYKLPGIFNTWTHQDMQPIQ